MGPGSSGWPSNSERSSLRSFSHHTLDMTHGFFVYQRSGWGSQGPIQESLGAQSVCLPHKCLTHGSCHPAATCHVYASNVSKVSSSKPARNLDTETQKPWKRKPKSDVCVSRVAGCLLNLPDVDVGIPKVAALLTRLKSTGSVSDAQISIHPWSLAESQLSVRGCTGWRCSFLLT